MPLPQQAIMCSSWIDNLSHHQGLSLHLWQQDSLVPMLFLWRKEEVNLSMKLL